MENRLRYIRLAICDREEETMIRLENFLEERRARGQVQIHIDTMKNGAQLVRKIMEQESYDIICLESELSDTDGIQLAKTIRETDEETVFLVLAADESRIKEIFDIMPAVYLKKPVERQEFLHWLERSIRRMTDERKYYVFNFNRRTYHVPYRRICYLESRNHKLVIKTELEEYSLYGKLDEEEERLRAAGGMFFRIHKSYIVNYWHIHWLDGSAVENVLGLAIIWLRGSIDPSVRLYGAVSNIIFWFITKFLELTVRKPLEDNGRKRTSMNRITKKKFANARAARMI